MKIIRRRQFLTRVALAVVAGIAEEDKYPAILNTLRTVRHVSPLTVIAQCLMGVRPVEPGFKTFAIAPQYVFFKRASHSFAIPQGMVSTAYHIDNEGTLTMDLTIPRHTRALVDIPATDRGRISVDGRRLAKGQVVAVGPSSSTCRLKPGTHRIVVEGYRQATQ